MATCAYCEMMSSFNNHGKPTFADADADFIETINGEYLRPFVESFWRKNQCNRKFSLEGSDEEIENWRHNVFNGKLLIFMAICLTCDQHNNVKSYAPWLADRKWSDDDLLAALKLTEEEKELMRKTLRKYERKSKWFRRYMGGRTQDTQTCTTQRYSTQSSAADTR